MPHLESKTKLIMTASVNRYINPQKFIVPLQRPILKYNFKFVQAMNNLLINRELLSTINNIFRYFSVLTLTGPRQSGKTRTKATIQCLL